jgi:fucose 4-O-acetylase-like acetyltransferase
MVATAILKLQGSIMQAAAPVHRKRLLDIDRAKGIAIFLVVLGHIGIPRLEPVWMADTRGLIYSFHMPLFMYLSGFVYFYTKSQLKTADAYRSFFLNRAERLLVPFILFGVILISGKYIAGQFVYIKDYKGYFSSFYYMFFDTTRSPVISIWYLFVLFVYTVATPLLFRVTGGRLLPLIILAVIMHYAPYVVDVSDNFYFDRIMKFYIFFLVGALVFEKFEVAGPLLRQYSPLWAVIFVVLLLLLSRTEYRYLPVGLASMACVHGFTLNHHPKCDRVLEYFGDHSFVIYLLNTAFIGLCQAVFLKAGMPREWFMLLVFAALVSGLFGPIALKMALQWSAPTRRLGRIIT